MIVIDNNDEKTYFCSKCGTHYNTLLDECPKCHIKLKESTPYKVKRQCNQCHEIVQASPSFFSDHPLCPSCKSGVLKVIEKHHNAPHFVLDGNWDGKSRDIVIKEKNEMLKKKHSGYSYETPKSIKDKTIEKYKERKGR